MQTRGQVSIFIVVGILILIFSSFLYTKYTVTLPQSHYSESLAIQSFVQSCVDLAVRSGVREFGLRGGLTTPALFQPSLVINGRYIAYYRVGSTLLDLPLEYYEGYLSEWIGLEMSICLQGIADQVVQKPLLPEVRSSITNQGVLVHVKVPVIIKVGDAITAVPSEYASHVNINVLPFIEEAKSWAVEERSYGSEDIFRVSDAENKRWVMTASSWMPNSTVVMIVDTTQRIGNEPFVFMFGTTSEEVVS
ncbi:MAG: hypothetical protein AABX52_00030 [Nanoarchaeota archaeon]